MIEYALIYAYGVTSIAKGIYYYSIKYGYFVNNDNYLIFKYFLIFIFFIYGLLIFLINFSLKSNKSTSSSPFIYQEKLFIAGAGIFVGTYLVSSNVDYRLVFLVLTIPYLSLNLKNSYFIFYCLILVISFNSLIFQIDKVYGLNFLINAIFVYSSKIIIFSVNCFYLGNILNKYVNLREIKLNIKKS